MRPLVVFGSASDEEVYGPLLDKIRDTNPIFHVASAHREPDKLDRILKEEKYDWVLAGAGLSAHLPGVVASKTLKPVFGVPVRKQFGGLDALCSIVQMPPGVPVAATFTPELIPQFLKRFVDNPIVEVGVPAEGLGPRQEKFDKAVDKISYSIKIVEAPSGNLPYLGLMNRPMKFNFPMMGVPLMSDEEATDPQSVMKLFEICQEQFWVGVNNFANGLLFYQRIYLGRNDGNGL